MGKASGVIVAKAKSMHGMQLKKEDYIELLHKKSVAEIAGYLKNQTIYHDVLHDVRENHIHRGQLEDMLQRDYFRKTMKLYRYAQAPQKQFYWLHMQQIEIELILSCLRAVKAKQFNDAIIELPVFLKGYTSFDIFKLGNVRTYDEFLEVMKHTCYYEILVTHRQGKGMEEQLDYTAIETQIHRYYYDQMFNVIDKTLHKTSRNAVKKLILCEIELRNIVNIYRFKKYFGAREDVIREALIPRYDRLSKQQIDEMIAEQTLAGVLKRLKDGPYHLHINENEHPYLERDTDFILYREAYKNMYYSNDAPTVYTSYLLLQKLEIENLINIIEGVRYQVHHDDIEGLLMY